MNTQDTTFLRIYELQVAIDNLTALLKEPDACLAMWQSRHDIWQCDTELHNIILNTCPIREAAE